MTQRTAIVTGASSGVGYELCSQLQQAGWQTYGISRRGTVPEGARGISADVTDESGIRQAFARILKETGGIDLLICNAGFGISGPVEFSEAEEVRRQMDVNFMGQFLCAKEALPVMRGQRRGTIVFVSSVAAQIAIPYQAFYSASKAAVSSLACALRNEVRESGISICAVLPGDVATGFTDSRRKAVNDESAYPHCAKAVASMEKDERTGMTPAYAAAKILKAAWKKHPKPLIVIGGKYKLFMGLFKVLPSSLAYRIVGRMY